jgi:uncharacterized membrane protein HdeD (DUF308 family)
MKQLLAFLTIAVMFCTGLQAMVPSMPFSNPDQVKAFSGILVCAGIALTAFKQFASDEINNKALIPTLIVALVATLAGVADLMDKLPMNPHNAQWFRFAISALTLLLNITSTTLFSGASLIAVLLLLCLNGCFITKECKVNYVSSDPGQKSVCLTCPDSLGNQIIDTIAGSVHIRLNKVQKKLR